MGKYSLNGYNAPDSNTQFGRQAMWELLSHVWHEVWMAFIFAVLFAIAVDVMQVGPRFRRFTGIRSLEEEHIESSTPRIVKVAQSITDSPRQGAKRTGWISSEARELIIMIVVAWSVMLGLMAVFATGRMHHMLCGDGNGSEGWFCHFLRVDILPADTGFKPDLLPPSQKKTECTFFDSGTLNCTLTSGGFPDAITVPAEWKGCFHISPMFPGNMPEKEWWIAFRFGDGQISGPHRATEQYSLSGDTTKMQLQGHGYALIKQYSGSDCNENKE